MPPDYSIATLHEIFTVDLAWRRSRAKQLAIRRQHRALTNAARRQRKRMRRLARENAERLKIRMR